MAKVFGKLQLPKYFAQQLLQSQIQMYLNQKICPDLIRKSIQLYTTGLQYYQSIRSCKYLYFKKKMEDLVKNPIIVSQLNSFNIKENQSLIGNSQEILEIQPLPYGKDVFLDTFSLSSPRNQNTIKNNEKNGSLHRSFKADFHKQMTYEQQQKKIELLEIRQKCQRLHNEIITNTTGITSQKIKNILNENQLKVYQTKQIIRQQIKQQQKKLKQKLQQRKLKKQFRKSLITIGNWGEAQKSTSTSISNQQQFDQNDQNQNSIKDVTEFQEVIEIIEQRKDQSESE